MENKLNNDDRISVMIAKIAELKEQLKSTDIKFSPTTNCVLTFSGVKYNLQAMNTNQLMILGAQLYSLKQSAKVVFPGVECAIDGYLVESWITDVQNKFNSLNRVNEENKLKKWEQELHQRLSHDKRVGLELDEFESQLLNGN